MPGHDGLAQPRLRNGAVHALGDAVDAVGGPAGGLAVAGQVHRQHLPPGSILSSAPSTGSQVVRLNVGPCGSTSGGRSSGLA